MALLRWLRVPARAAHADAARARSWLLAARGGRVAWTEIVVIHVVLAA